MAVFSLIGDLLTKAPKVPGLQPIDVGEQQTKAIAANKRSFGDIAELTKQGTALNLETIDQLLGGSGIRSQVESNLLSALRGEVPEDVQNLLRRQAAEIGTATGTAGSGFNRNLFLRDLGLTSLQRSDQAIDAASRWLNTARQGTFDFSSMFVSPDQFLQQANIDRSFKFQRDWMQNQISQAFATSTKIGNAFKTFDDQLMQLASSVLGGFLGGRQNGPAPQQPS